MGMVTITVVVLFFHSLQSEKLTAEQADGWLALAHNVPPDFVRVVRRTLASNNAISVEAGDHNWAAAGAEGLVKLRRTELLDSVENGFEFSLFFSSGVHDFFFEFFRGQFADT